MKNLLIVLILILLIACDPIAKSVGPFSSDSIEKSKTVGAYLWEYEPIDKSITILDTIDLKIDEVFAEKMYYYNSYEDLRYRIPKDESQIRIIFDKDLYSLRHYDLWDVDSFHHVGNGLSRTYNDAVPPDTIIVKIQKVGIGKDGLDNEEDGKVIGSFKMRRKK
ncbi:hypothetical protein WG947_14530 [Pontibacter sp. H259]|uniref:hypothetical protein n=1 Tax=Pontibacter sp. H259 TaxID=3133421 RepID=UPI0030BBA864